MQTQITIGSDSVRSSIVWSSGKDCLSRTVAKLTRKLLWERGKHITLPLRGGGHHVTDSQHFVSPGNMQTEKQSFGEILQWEAGFLLQGTRFGSTSCPG
ncbi:hypothetical protein DPEC_G00213040 [Dallia pectoralis]|uniref:Uncharacterized protein n=1 Tax=Dallia pectoralis TaxID=75939 RepID=A0ACC2G6H5_DALPE|nr:hypothetical protein DPEC_G00213040 [Dallia pectoralis]